MYWQLNRVMYPVENLGAGKRIVIWVQGCSMFCDGCISPDLWDRNGGRQVDLAGFAASVLSLGQNLDGITITGGEPFDQYHALVAFCSFVKQKANLEILVFSGYTMDQLFEKFPDQLFARCIDFVVDGPYVKSLHDDGRLRGSKNQKMYTFDVDGEEVKAIEIEIPPNGTVWSAAFDRCKNIVMSGIPAKGDSAGLREKMEQSGIDFVF